MKTCKICGIKFEGMVCPNCSLTKVRHPNGKFIKCPKCTYQWRTTATLQKTNCPSCNIKIPNPHFKK